MKVLGVYVRPEVDEFKYWVHLLIISSAVLGLIQLLRYDSLFSFGNILFLAAFIGFSDIIAHTLLGLD